MTLDDLKERHMMSLRSYERAREKLFEGLEAWRLEKTPHTEDRLQHYYLVYKDCKRNLKDAAERLDKGYFPVW